MKFFKISIFSLLAAFFVAFAAISCKKTDSVVDPCSGISCQNGGTCLNGSCSCPTGYEGPACEKQKTPTIVIKSITITKFPATTANGGGWDLTSGADIYPIMSFGTSKIWISPNYQNNAAVGSYKFTLSPVLKIPAANTNETYGFEVWDYDSGLNSSVDSDDFMGGVTGKLYNSTNGFPKTMTFSCSNCETAFLLELDYEF